MEVETALKLVNEGVIFLPNWEVIAEDHTDRFGDAICVKFNITDARRSEREFAPGYTEVVPNGARARFPIYVGDIHEPTELLGRVLDAALDNFAHEAREFLRLQPTGWAPFHPHRDDGIRRWAERTGRDPMRDYLFGIA